MKDKFQIIFIPAVITLLGLTVGYTFLHWLLFIKLELFSIKEFVTNFGIPLVLAGVAAWIVLRPRLKILNLQAKKGDWVGFYSFILWAVLTVPAIIAQEYIVTASGELTALQSINEIDDNDPTKYYTLQDYYIDKQSIGVHSAFDVSGKHNESFNMHIYIALPIYERAADTARATCAAWLGLEYRETISNRLEPEEKKQKYQEFALSSQRDFDLKKQFPFVYLDRIGNSDKKDGLVEAVKESHIKGPGETILIPVNEPFEARNGDKLAWIVGSSTVGLLVWLIMLAFPKINESELQRIRSGRPDHAARRESREMFDFFKPREGFFVTPVLIYINVGIYALMALLGLGFISFKGEDLVTWGANYGPLTLDGEWWRLLTSTFLHGGLMHIFANMYGLMFVGIFLEPLLGRTRYLTVYLVTGIIGSIASIWWYDATISVGASGAIFGLYGFFLATIVTKIFPPELGKAFLTSVIIFVGYSLLMGLMGGVDNAAHIGGLVSGFVAALAMYPALKQAVSE